MPSKRRLARTVVMQTLFEMETRTVDPDACLLHNLKKITEMDGPVDDEFCMELFSGVHKNMQQVRDSIAKNAPQWPLERMDTISRCILLVGGYELLFAKDAPPAVVMNEAIEIAKAFGPEESPKFVNGVLNALAHSK